MSATTTQRSRLAAATGVAIVCTIAATVVVAAAVSVEPPHAAGPAAATTTPPVQTTDTGPRRFTVTASVDEVAGLTRAPLPLAAVTVDIPAAGRVVVDSRVAVTQFLDAGGLACTIVEGGHVPESIGFNSELVQVETAGLLVRTRRSGTRTFEVGAGTTATFAVACQDLGAGAVASGATLLATYVPTG